MENRNNTAIAEGRKRFMKIGLFAIGGAALAKFVPGFLRNSRLASSGEKVKMLTTDGRLVEVDKAFLKKGRKASLNDVKNWVKKPKA